VGFTDHEAVVEAVRLMARRLGAKIVLVGTKSGRTALALSKQRYAPPTLALTDDPVVARAMALYWGVTPLIRSKVTDHQANCDFVREWASAHGLLTRGDCILAVQGTTPNRPGHNAVLVEEVE